MQLVYCNDLNSKGVSVGYDMMVILIFMLGLLHTAETQGAIKDYCIADSFNVSCPRDHVILMTHAMYGRMKAGHCIDGEGTLGCSTDVIQHFDNKCSGRKLCKVNVVDLIKYRTCKKDYSSYLEASYQCIKVPNTGAEDCSGYNTGGNGISVTGSEGFVMYSNDINKQSHVIPGVVNCPWNIEVNPGQRINITILNLSPKHLSSTCNDKLRIVDGDESNEYSICTPGDQDRMRNLYVSKHNKISIFLSQLSYYGGIKTQKFLLRYKAIGCPDKDPPVNGWLHRQGSSTLMIKCNYTEETWYLTCTDNNWMGDFGNCTSGHHPTILMGHPDGEISLYIPHGIVFAVLIGIVLGVMIGALLLLAVHCYKQRRTNVRKSNFVMVPQDIKEKYYEEGTYTASTTVTSNEGQLKDPYPALLRDSEVYETNRSVPVIRNNPNTAQCYAVDSHTIHIKTYPHDKSVYPSNEQQQCTECVCPGKPIRCDPIPVSRLTDLEQQF